MTYFRDLRRVNHLQTMFGSVVASEEPSLKRNLYTFKILNTRICFIIRQHKCITLLYLLFGFVVSSLFDE